MRNIKLVSKSKFTPYILISVYYIQLISDIIANTINIAKTYEINEPSIPQNFVDIRSLIFTKQPEKFVIVGNSIFDYALMSSYSKNNKRTCVKA